MKKVGGGGGGRAVLKWGDGGGPKGLCLKKNWPNKTILCKTCLSL